MLDHKYREKTQQDSIKRVRSKIEKPSLNIFSFNQLFERKDKQKKDNRSKNMQILKREISMEKVPALIEQNKRQQFDTIENSSCPLDQFLNARRSYQQITDIDIQNQTKNISLSLPNKTFISCMDAPMITSHYCYDNIHESNSSCYEETRRFKVSSKKVQSQRQKMKQDIVRHLERQNANLKEHRDFLTDETKKLKNKLSSYKEEIKNYQKIIKKLEEQNEYVKQQYLQIKDQLFRGINRKMILSSKASKQQTENIQKQLPSTDCRVKLLENSKESWNKQSQHAFCKTNPFSIQQEKGQQVESQSRFAEIKNDGESPSKYKVLMQDQDKNRELTYFKLNIVKDSNLSPSPTNIRGLYFEEELQISPVCQNLKLQRQESELKDKESQNQSYLLSPKHTQIAFQDLNKRFKDLVKGQKDKPKISLDEKSKSNRSRQNCTQIARQIREIREKYGNRGKNSILFKKDRLKNQEYDQNLQQKLLEAKKSHTRSASKFKNIKNIENANKTVRQATNATAQLEQNENKQNYNTLKRFSHLRKESQKQKQNQMELVPRFTCNGESKPLKNQLKAKNYCFQDFDRIKKYMPCDDLNSY